MDSLASSSVELPAEGLKDIDILPFNNTAKFEKAIAERLQAIEDGENVLEWIAFSDFDSSKLKLIDRLQRHHPIRLQLDNNTLVVKMVHPVHEAMHNGLWGLIEDDMRRIGLRLFHDYGNTGSGRCHHHSRNSFKEPDSSIIPGPFQPVPGQPPWPSFVIEAGWSESFGRLRIDAEWWLSAQIPPNATTLVVLISFKRPQRTFHLEKYELVAVNGTSTGGSPLGVRNIAMSTGKVTISLQTTPPTITGAPFILPFTGIMRRPPMATERDISISAVDLESWATFMASLWNL